MHQLLYSGHIQTSPSSRSLLMMQSPSLLAVVDFVNGVGPLRDALEEFFDTTTWATGPREGVPVAARTALRAVQRVTASSSSVHRP
jgi:hypothetical protein